MLIKFTVKLLVFIFILIMIFMLLFGTFWFYSAQTTDEFMNRDVQRITFTSTGDPENVSYTKAITFLFEEFASSLGNESVYFRSHIRVNWLKWLGASMDGAWTFIRSFRVFIFPIGTLKDATQFIEMDDVGDPGAITGYFSGFEGETIRAEDGNVYTGKGYYEAKSLYNNYRQYNTDKMIEYVDAFTIDRAMIKTEILYAYISMLMSIVITIIIMKQNPVRFTSDFEGIDSEKTKTPSSNVLDDSVLNGIPFIGLRFRKRKKKKKGA